MSPEEFVKPSEIAKALPHGNLEPVFDNVWYVQGQVKMPMLMPAKISRTMTVIRNPGKNELTLVNSMRLGEPGIKELEALGKITNVIRVGGFHGRDDAFYRQSHQARVFAIRGQTYSRKMETPENTDDGFMQPDVWVETVTDLPIENCELKIIRSSSPPEALLILKQDGGILVTGDSLQNTPAPDKFVNLPMKIMMKKFGFWKEYNVGPGWLQFGKPSRQDVRSILDLSFEHVIPGHGKPVIDNAKEKYRPAIEGELKGCHE